MKLNILGTRINRAPKHILVTRLSAIGDCVLTIPLAVAAKKLWPSARITWVVDCAAAQLLQDHPCVDEVIRIERKWLQRPSNWSNMRRELRSRGFDLVLDPQGLTKSSMLGWLSGAKQRIGFDYSHGREVAPLLATRRVTRTQRHMVDTYLQLLSPFELQETGSGEFSMPVYTAAAERVVQMLQTLGLSSDDAAIGNSNWIAINPGAGWTTRQWPVERFGKLSKQLYDAHGRTSLVFWAGDNERLMANVIAEESGGAAQVAPATSLCELLEMFRRTSLLVSSDTGPLHIASSIGAPSVSLHGPTWADECGPYSNRAIAIQSPTPNVSKRMQRRGPNVAMQAIEIDEVFRACSRMIANEPNRQRMAA